MAEREEKWVTRKNEKKNWKRRGAPACANSAPDEKTVRKNAPEREEEPLCATRDRVVLPTRRTRAATRSHTISRTPTVARAHTHERTVHTLADVLYVVNTAAAHAQQLNNIALTTHDYDDVVAVSEGGRNFFFHFFLSIRDTYYCYVVKRNNLYNIALCFM